MLWVSPTEPSKLRAIADRVSMFPEEYGADVAVVGASGMLAGVQRKTVADLLASVADGRLAEQVMKMASLDLAFLVVEGNVRWVNGELAEAGGWGPSVSKQAWMRQLMSVRAAGVQVVEGVRSLDETIEWVEVFDAWMQADSHSTLGVKGRAVNGAWGERHTEHYRIAMLASLPGVGEELARRMLDEVGWPFELKVDLTGVRGLGPKKVAKIREVCDE